MGVSGIFHTVPYKTDLVGEQIVAITWAGGTSIKTMADSNWLLISWRLRCWLHCIWHGCIASVCNVLSCGEHLDRRKFSCSSEWTSLCLVRNVFLPLPLHFAVAGVQHGGLQSERVLFLSGVGRHVVLRIVFEVIVARYSSSAAVALPLQNPHTKRISAYSSL